MLIARRTALGLGLAGAAGCAPMPSPSPPGDAPSSAPAVPDAGPTSPSAPVSPTPVPSAHSGEPALPSRDDIVARYSGRAPAQWGLEVEGVVLRSDSDAIALTFDACGGPNGSGYDAGLIEALRELSVPATLFLNRRWIEANDGVARELAGDPLFELANHGSLHKPLSVRGETAYGIPGTASPGEVFDEVMGGHQALAELTGERPVWFRSGTAHVDDVAVAIVGDLAQRVVNFDVNVDAGATFSAAQVERALSGATGGSICIAHFNKPGSGTAAGVIAALPRLLDAGHRFATLGEVLVT